MNHVADTDIANIYGESFKECKFFWTPFTDKYREGTFVDELSNETINEIQWQQGQPDGGLSQNYVCIWPQKKLFFDFCPQNCVFQRSSKYKFRFQFKKNAVLNLKNRVHF